MKLENFIYSNKIKFNSHIVLKKSVIGVCLNVILCSWAGRSRNGLKTEFEKIHNLLFQSVHSDRQMYKFAYVSIPQLPGTEVYVSGSLIVCTRITKLKNSIYDETNIW